MSANNVYHFNYLKPQLMLLKWTDIIPFASLAVIMHQLIVS